MYGQVVHSQHLGGGYAHASPMGTSLAKPVGLMQPMQHGSHGGHMIQPGGHMMQPGVHMPQVNALHQNRTPLVGQHGQPQQQQQQHQSSSTQPLTTHKVHASSSGTTSIIAPQVEGVSMLREQALERRVRELEMLLIQRDTTIKELQEALSTSPAGMAAAKKMRAPARGGSGGLRKVAESKPDVAYTAVDQDDNIDARLEDFYNSTASAIQFKRINRGFYRFGSTIVELDIINHKLMARTEDGWNRGKFGPIDKFMMDYENTEREKVGIASDL